MRPMGAVYGWGEEPLTAASGVLVVAGVAAAQPDPFSVPVRWVYRPPPGGETGRASSPAPSLLEFPCWKFLRDLGFCHHRLGFCHHHLGFCHHRRRRIDKNPFLPVVMQAPPLNLDTQLR